MFVALAVAATHIACGKAGPGEREVPTSGAKPPAAAAPAAPEPAAPGPAQVADAGAPTSEDAGAVVAADASTAEPEPAQPEPVRAFDRALRAVADCERLPDSIRVKDQAACLAPVSAARNAVRSPPPVDGVAVSPEEVTALRAAMAESLRAALDDPNPTVVLYALMQNQPDFARDASTLARLQALVDSDEAEVAEWAMTVRTWQRNPQDEGARLLALSVLANHRFDRVRLAACQYLGDPMFRGQPGMFDVLRERADDGNESELIRNCAVMRMGYLGDDDSVDAIAAHLPSLVRQAGAVQALQRGLASPKAHKAYLKWFDQHAQTPDALQWTAVANLAPPAPGAASYPVDEGTRVLTKIASAKRQPAQVRAAAVSSLERLGAVGALKSVASKLAGAQDEDSLAVRAAVERALASTPAPASP